ncbi:hypothetical protein [Marinoscillum sp. MHG1-6]|uniref:hypothetical protein n=1 Tax=Marinoscillum sp. MHG1-6 TaxID=2959627 RepID=UPI00215769E9|nr:hypothetical protein [Marinoscillum sp. MHG1-6]
MEFGEYLESKKISSKSFEQGEGELYKSFEKEFMQMHPNSFTAQKLFSINKLRRKYPIQAQTEETKTSSKPAAAKPKMKPRPKL